MAARRGRRGQHVPERIPPFPRSPLRDCSGVATPEEELEAGAFPCGAADALPGDVDDELGNMAAKVGSVVKLAEKWLYSSHSVNSSMWCCVKQTPTYGGGLQLGKGQGGRAIASSRATHVPQAVAVG